MRGCVAKRFGPAPPSPSPSPRNEERGRTSSYSAFHILQSIFCSPYSARAVKNKRCLKTELQNFHWSDCPGCVSCSQGCRATSVQNVLGSQSLEAISRRSAETLTRQSRCRLDCRTSRTRRWKGEDRLRWRSVRSCKISNRFFALRIP
jgi:NAD-dependent dihydropyrimidine dehydrogenase PreA subunit